jgi:predicted DNA-binding protein
MSKSKSSSTDRHKPYKLVRIPMELYQRIKDLAERNDRPTSREVKRALEAHLRSQEGQQ